MPDTVTITTIGNFVAGCRLGLKRAQRVIDSIQATKDQAKRELDRLRSEGGVFDAHRIATLEGHINHLEQCQSTARQVKIDIGGDIMRRAEWIDANTTVKQRYSLFNVNLADAGELPENASTTDIVYVYKLSDSVEQRGKDFGGCLLSEAATLFMCVQLFENRKLNDMANEYLFGKGGMFEFIPTYTKVGDELVRNPPKLRVADECDLDKSITLV